MKLDAEMRHARISAYYMTRRVALLCRHKIRKLLNPVIKGPSNVSFDCFKKVDFNILIRDKNIHVFQHTLFIVFATDVEFRLQF